MPADTSLVDRLVSGDPRALARAISLVEDEAADGAALIRDLYPKTGRAYLVGITGPPGAGKSTLVDRLTTEVRRAGQTVGVIAVDPTSPFTGGAILGDRVRMGGHTADAGVFIRSMATRGHRGGLARATSDAALVLDASGKDIVIIETVGVGQDEVDIVRTADISIVVLVPGTGDDVQALKAGIMEIADIFVVNKADHEGAERLVQAVTASLSLQEPPGVADPGAWRPPVLKTVAVDGAGIGELWTAIQAFREQAAPAREARQLARQEYRLRDVLSQRFLQQVAVRVPDEEWRRLIGEIAARRIDPYSAAAAVMKRMAE